MTWAERRRIPVLLAGATVIPVVVLGWLGVRILQQDRDVERQRQRERLEVAAGRLALDIERRLQQVEEQLGQPSDPPGTSVRFAPSGLTPAPNFRLLYQPEVASAHNARSLLLAAAEVEEFQRRDLLAATAAYKRLANTGGAEVRASALVGLSRVLRQQGNRSGAFDAASQLEQLGSTQVAGQPAALVARQLRCKWSEEAGDREALHAEANQLARVLYDGGLPIDRVTFDLYRDMLDRWGASIPAADDTATVRARTDAAIELWRMWRRGDLASRGRRLLRSGGGPMLVVWSGGPEHPSVWLATPAELETALGPLWTTQALAVSVSDIDGHAVFGPAPSTNITATVSLTPGDTRLPFILSVASLGVDENADSMRRAVLLGGLAVAFALMFAAAYGLYRATTRELGLARQQADFVSAVSHEFRTPLTSMRHLTDLLVSRGNATSDERKTQYYALLAHETERLQRMVETLLSFGRIEEGAYAWRLEPIDAAELVRANVEEFQREPLARGRQLLTDVDENLPPIRADREALSRAMWNLLENAAKYSEAGRPIRVFAHRQGDAVLLGVGDEGVGIPPEERDHIFQKFVRGAGAKQAGVRGVGIGLALVRRIVEAHGGSVRLESEPGRGSTFTLVIPCPGF